MAGETKGHDVGALIGWLLVALWGWVTYAGADEMRNDPRTIRPDDKAHLLMVTGGLLVAIGLGFAGAAVIRLAGSGQPLLPPSASLILGVTLIIAFVAFFLWGRSLTHGQGVSAAGLVAVPYALAGVAVLFARRRRLEHVRVP